MGLFDIFRHPANKVRPNGLTPEEREFLRKLHRLDASGNTISPEIYQQLRDFQAAWLERNYDFSTLEGILAIPETRTPPGAPFDVGPAKSPTGEVYYYLRHKAYRYEEAGRMDLALACMRKSVTLVRYVSYSSPDDYYPLVKMLARAGMVNEACREKASIDKLFGGKCYPDSIISVEKRRGDEVRDYAWIQSNIPEKCPKSLSGFRRMKTQNTKNYQLLQKAAADLDRKI